MKVFMMIVFILASGEQVSPSGWEPREMKSVEECQRKKAAAVEFIEYGISQGQLPKIYIGYKVSCVVQEIEVVPLMQ
jgi:hypothetical protein|tara:strand:+ start:1023 stop:1253 length:231 start_codon:yes stop_codon:yes gene_type:complete